MYLKETFLLPRILPDKSFARSLLQEIGAFSVSFTCNTPIGLADNLAISVVKGSEKIAAGRCFIVHYLVVVEVAKYLYWRISGHLTEYFLDALIEPRWPFGSVVN
jgi:hypothetical protein